MAKEVYWHLPGLCNFRLLNQILINLMKDYPSKFKDGYKIGSVYGTFPGAIWNGGRAVFGTVFKGDIDRIIKMYNSRGIPVRFTWTNSLLEEKHNQDTFCNMIMQLADNGKNQVLVNRPSLEEYIRREYPNFPVISSTTKRIVTLADIKEELYKDYHLVVLDYDLNHDETVLRELDDYEKWPCRYHLDILAHTDSWKSEENIKIIADAIAKMMKMDCPELVGFTANSWVGYPLGTLGCFPSQGFSIKTTCLLPSPISIEYRNRPEYCHLEYIEWLARCGVVSYIPELQVAVNEINNSLDENGICNIPVLADLFKGWAICRNAIRN